jgi:hypothetical protein
MRMKINVNLAVETVQKIKHYPNRSRMIEAAILKHLDGLEEARLRDWEPRHLVNHLLWRADELKMTEMQKQALIELSEALV